MGACVSAAMGWDRQLLAQPTRLAAAPPRYLLNLSSRALCSVAHGRRLAHAKVQREKRRAAKEAAAAGKSGGGGWMGWLTGGGSGGGKTASPRAGQVSRRLRAHGIFVLACCVVLGTADDAKLESSAPAAQPPLLHDQPAASARKLPPPAGWGRGGA